ncbi:PKD domain-containing protein [Ideonella paludis]|uniref:PKD domain-containing protein n=1 Tax=Ideonella paludis TaxID=1233411 RepID=UPI00362B474A
MLTVCAPSPAPKTPRLLCAGQAGQRPLATGLMARAALGTLLMCSAAAQAQVVDCSALPIWNASAIYTGGKQAQDSGKAYQANWWTQNQPPASNSGAGAVWKLLGTCNSGGGGGGPGGNKAPVANFTATIDHLSVALDGSSSKDADGSISSYQWNFGDGGSGTGAKASRSYATPGTYPVTLTVTDNQGAKNSKSQSVTVASVVRTPSLASTCSSKPMCWPPKPV